MPTYTQYYVGKPDPANPSQPLRDAQGRRVLWIAPVGYVPLIGQVVDPLADGWPRYYGPENVLSSECASGPVTDPDAPVWGDDEPPGFVPGAYWEWIIPLDAATPAPGQTIGDYAEHVLPAYLEGIHAGPNLKIYGTIPEGVTPVFSVYALQSNGKATSKTFTLDEIAEDVYLYYRYYAGEKRIVVRVGADSSTHPSVSLSGPVSWTDTGTYQMQRFGANINDKNYFFVWPNYLNPPAGAYTLTVVHQRRTLFGQLTINPDADSEGEVLLTTTADAYVVAVSELYGLEADSEPECPNYAKLTPEQHNALPLVTIFERIGDVPPGWKATVRAFNSQAELLNLIRGSQVNFDFVRCTSSTCQVGATLYGSNNPPDTDFAYWPAEQGFWGFNRNLPTTSGPGSVTVLETNACGVIINRTIIPLYLD